MKTKILSIFGVSALLLGAASCSNELPVDTSKINPADVATNFIAVNLVTNGGTRADADNPSNEEYYEEGNSVENNVETVRFYFFDESGKAFPVLFDDNGSPTSSYVNVTQMTIGDPDMPNIEKTIKATAAVETDGENFPSQIIVVINPTDDLTDKMPSIDDLNAVISDFSTTANGFVMSNSVFAYNQETMEPVKITSEYFYTAPAAAEANPVNVYVERVLAKVTLSVDNLTDGSLTVNGETLYDTGVKYGNEEIYVKFLGWNVTATTQSSYLMKHINPKWEAELFGASTETGLYEPWNYSPFHRSYWAINPTELKFGYFNFGEGTTDGKSDGKLAADGIKGFSNDVALDPNYTYLQENAATGNTGVGASHPSQVIIAAQLCHKNGTPFEIAEWGFGKYSVPDLKKAFLSHLAAYYDLYYATDNNGRSQITENDITFVTAGSLDTDIMNWEATGRYYVYAQLTPAAKEYTWYNGKESDVVISADAINALLKDLDHAKVWSKGYTYYYFDIRHLGANEDDPGYYGVVRNHVYKADINTLVGLGTPVYDPNEVIYPEKPEDEDTYISAAIKILSWRIVNQGVDLNW